MMIALKNCPKVLVQKLFLTLAIGIGCIIIGGAYFLASNDTVLLMLSSAIFIFSLVRSLGLYKTLVKGRYGLVEGVCIGITPKPLRKYRKIRIMDDTGLETSLLLGKQTKFKIGFSYRFYFKEEPKLSLGSEYLDTALSGDNLLGFEELGEYSFNRDNVTTSK